MGAGHEVYCEDCRKRWYCGYCSYGNASNYIARSPIAEHEAAGHQTGHCTEDYTHIADNGDLMIENQRGSDVLVSGYNDFEYFDLSKD